MESTILPSVNWDKLYSECSSDLLNEIMPLVLNEFAEAKINLQQAHLSFDKERLIKIIDSLIEKALWCYFDRLNDILSYLYSDVKNGSTNRLFLVFAVQELKNIEKELEKKGFTIKT